jgi:hypothetical protein
MMALLPTATNSARSADQQTPLYDCVLGAAWAVQAVPFADVMMRLSGAPAGPALATATNRPSAGDQQTSSQADVSPAVSGVVRDVQLMPSGDVST